MALKPDRIELQTDVSFFMSSTATRGGVASVSPASTGVGVAMDDANAVVVYAAVASGSKPVGVLLNDVVNLDLTRQHINWHKDEVQQGGKVTLLQVGQVTTNLVSGTPDPGDVAYVAASGYVGNDPDDGNNAPVGRFLSAKDSDGYAKVAVNIA